MPDNEERDGSDYEETERSDSWGERDERDEPSLEFPGASFGSSGDSVTEVSEKGLFARLGESIGTALLGVVFFLASFVVLYKNEGTVDESKMARSAVEISAAAPDASKVGQFVAATGPLASQAKLGDEFLAPGNYLKLTREAQMYAWVENKESRTEKQVGGSEKTVTTYSYKRDWTGYPRDSDKFKRQVGHHNPPMTVKGTSVTADQGSLGSLSLDMAKVALPSGSPLRLSEASIKGGTAVGNQLYVGRANPNDPRVGDVRVTYSALAPGGTYTVLGKLESASAIGPAMVEDREFYRVFQGSKKDALETLSTEYKLWIWGFRLLGFLLCWGGLGMMVSPINTLLDVLPFLGSFGRGLTGFVTFPIALFLSGLTILIAWITHSLVAMVVIGVAGLLLGIRLFGAKKAPKAAARAA
ncbi:MAG: TMEM43 family protein [Candidatus Sericytochromatia bacterium]|nr:TMEM43 family protein [Candidatus Sericytochromatia bacterium]